MNFVRYEPLLGGRSGTHTCAKERGVRSKLERPFSRVSRFVRFFMSKMWKLMVLTFSWSLDYILRGEKLNYKMVAMDNF